MIMFAVYPNSMKFKEGEMVITVKFGELWLRGRNRGMYVNALKDNLLALLKGERFKLEKEYDRFIIRPNRDANMEHLKTGLSHLFGISGYEISYVTKPSLAAICRSSKTLLKNKKGIKAVRINAHRSYKKFKFNSIDITRNLIKVLGDLEISPELHNFDQELFVNVTKDWAFLSMDRAKGPGGLPVGTSGRGIVLLSGGIDSPVAAWYAMKRGVEPVFVHVHGYSDANEAMESKIPRLVGILSSYRPGIKTYYVPSHVFQMGALRSGRHELILLKAFMLRIADAIAEKENAHAIFTGESLGQVASQTMSNLQAEQNGVKTQILRPLIGFDKQEIISVAKRIGTYDESIKPYKDVCSINSKNPVTRTNPGLMSELIKEFKIAALVKKSLNLSKDVVHSR